MAQYRLFKIHNDFWIKIKGQDNPIGPFTEQEAKDKLSELASGFKEPVSPIIKKYVVGDVKIDLPVVPQDGENTIIPNKKSNGFAFK